MSYYKPNNTKIMAKKIITDFSESLANEIAQRKIYNIEGISILIEVRTKLLIRDLMNEYSTEAEKDYLKLLDQQSRNRINTNAYVQMGYKLAAAKQRKASANRAANNMGKEDDYQRLKNFVSHKFGREAINDFFNQDAHEIPDKLPIYRT